MEFMARSSTELEKPDHKERKTGLGQHEKRTNLAVDFMAGKKKPNLDHTVTLVGSQKGHASPIEVSQQAESEAFLHRQINMERRKLLHTPSKNKNRDLN
jgi:hypothetical protein